MSIDARIAEVEYDNGVGRLILIDRPAEDGKPAGIAGVSALSFVNAPEVTKRLAGLNIWGGADSIQLGSNTIARRTAYHRIQFLNQLEQAIDLYVEQNG